MDKSSVVSCGPTLYETVLLKLREFKNNKLNNTNAPMLISLLVLEMAEFCSEELTKAFCGRLAMFEFIEIFREKYTRITNKGLEAIKHIK